MRHSAMPPKIGTTIAARGAPRPCAGFARGLRGHTRAGADVYKCAGEGGRPVYQEMPCPPGKELRNFQTNPPGDHRAARHAGPAAHHALRRRRAATRERKTPSTRSPEGGHGRAATPAERKHLRAGMSEGEVLARLGPPDVTTGGEQRQAAALDLPARRGDPETITSITFTTGVVTDVERQVVKQ